jgi:hypothetical protein
MSVLREDGIPAAAPLGASDTRYISSWVEGEDSDITDPKFREYLRVFLNIRERLISQNRWDNRWWVDIISGNFKKVVNEDGKVSFVAIDPLAIAASEEQAERYTNEVRRLLHEAK